MSKYQVGSVARSFCDS